MFLLYSIYMVIPYLIFVLHPMAIKERKYGSESIWFEMEILKASFFGFFAVIAVILVFGPKYIKKEY